MYSSIGSLAVRTLSSLALEKLSLCEGGISKVVVRLRSKYLRIGKSWRDVIPSGCSHPRGLPGHTLYLHPPFLGLKYRLSGEKNSFTLMSILRYYHTLSFDF